MIVVLPAILIDAVQPRLNAAQRKRLAVLATPRPVHAWQGAGVMQVPAILPLDEWEARACASQRALASATREGVTEARDAEYADG